MDNHAVVITGHDQTSVLPVPYPSLPADHFTIVRTTAVALNPTDDKHTRYDPPWACDGCVLGYDYAGVIEEVGPGVQSGVKKGDRVFGLVNGG
jgi:NADPH:quinone reductase-like Zn-dependent oxidoreductase